MKAENFARFLVLIVIVGSALGVIASRLYNPGITIELHGNMPEAGGWNPDVLHAQVGEPLHLRLTADDVVHGFRIGQSDHPAVDIEPGKMTDLTLTFDEPGTYTFYCTRWCGLNHWRMRGTIEVSGKGADEIQPVSQPLFVSLDIDIDAPHPATVVPSIRPGLSDNAMMFELAEDYLDQNYYRSHSPDQVYRELRADNAYNTASDADIWAQVVRIWRTHTTQAGLAEGADIYAANCAACHGEAGAGDGVFAKEVQSQFGKLMTGMEHASGLPTDFTDAHNILGASPALLQGKIVRGGMGTGMPSWGSIFTDQQTWNLVAYLYTFHFDYPELNK